MSTSFYDNSVHVDKIVNGYVIDHITAGRGIEVYEHLNLKKLDCSVALIQNVRSSKYGRKDIIKVAELINIDTDILSYIDPRITLTTVRNNEVTKNSLTPPKTLTGVVKCRNPRCITSSEDTLRHVFCLSKESRENKPVYRCVYCEQENA